MSIAFIDVSGGEFTDKPTKPGKGFTPPPPLQAQGANCNWLDDDCASNGLPGGNGTWGVGGVPAGFGGNGGSITFEVDIINGGVKFLSRGGKGGPGGDGADGGDGGKGGKGGNGNGCEWSRVGGDGGNGGRGGDGGGGGRGGNGGSILVLCRIDNSSNSDPARCQGWLRRSRWTRRPGRGCRRARRYRRHD